MHSGMGAKDDVKSFVDYVIAGFRSKYATPSCAKAFHTLCVDNAKALSVFTGELIEKSNLTF